MNYRLSKLSLALAVSVGLLSLTRCGSSSSSSTKKQVEVTSTFSFFASGLEANNCASGATCNFYALAGVVTIDTSGNVVSGEQDYNDGYGITSPEPAGDSIVGGALKVNASGQGTLTLTTSNAMVGTAGTEVLAVQFVNQKHALIVQFDQSATSSGSMDLQTATLIPDGGYAFTLSGVNSSSYSPVALGGVLSLNSGALTGTVDVNDTGTVNLAKAVTGTVTPADKLGRGQITGISLNGITLTLNYYVVGPKVVRMIDVDPGNDTGAGNAAVGSAFGQGSGTFGMASIGKSVFAVQGNSWGSRLYAAAGMLNPNPGTGKFTGIGDEDEEGAIVAASPILGIYTLGANGYGRLTINNGGLQTVTSLGLYSTDPGLNLMDPNDTSGGGGALVLDLDGNLASGTGVVIPQTDTAAASFTGNYSFAGQAYDSTGALGYEFDYVGQGSVAGGVLSGNGAVNDRFAFFSGTPAAYKTVPFSGTASPDMANPGRYTMVPLDITANGSATPFSVVLYQASGGLLLWMDEDSASLSLGTIQR